MHDLYRVHSSILMKNILSLGIGFIKVSTSWLDEVTNSSMHSSFSTRSVIKWCITSIFCPESEEPGF